MSLLLKKLLQKYFILKVQPGKCQFLIDIVPKSFVIYKNKDKLFGLVMNCF